jgi:hypothetical protein
VPFVPGGEMKAAVFPASSEFGDEGLNILYLPHIDSQQRNADVGKKVVLKAIRVAPFFAAMRRVIKFDSEHGHQVFKTTDEEVHVLLTDPVESGEAIEMLDKIREPRFDEEMAALTRKLLEAGKKPAFNFRHDRLEGVFVLQGGEAVPGAGAISFIEL